MGVAFLGTPTVLLPRVAVTAMSPVMTLVTAAKTLRPLVVLHLVRLRVYMHAHVHALYTHSLQCIIGMYVCMETYLLPQGNIACA